MTAVVVPAMMSVAVAVAVAVASVVVDALVVAVAVSVVGVQMSGFAVGGHGYHVGEGGRA